MSSFLIFVPLPSEHAALGEALVKSAVCFLEASGRTVARTNLGGFRRGGRKDAADEVLALTALTTVGESADDPVRGRALEGVLRSTLAAAGVRGGDLRVFVSDG